MLKIMTRQSHYKFLVLCLVLDYVSSQYKPFQIKQPTPLSCSESNKNSLVEHFFDLIFSEFQNNPPVCVCVQMCSNQPTYCYPNGCLKKPEVKITTQTPLATTYAPTLLYKVQQKDETQPKSFIVHDQSEFMSNLLDRNYVAEKTSGRRNPAEERPFLSFKSEKELRPDPLTDSFKSIFKYKKIPKVHLRYNLREQVKNTKSDVVKIEKIDMSKTRWPSHKRSNFFLERLNDEAPQFSESVKVSPALALESGQAVLPTKFFKRDLRKIGSLDEEKDTDANNISLLLENLIESLINKSMGALLNDTELDFNVNVDYTISNVTTQLPDIDDTKFSQLVENDLSNDTSSANVFHEDFKNKGNVQKKNADNTKDIYRNVYNEMIATLSKNIDEKCNSSIQLMEKVVGNTEMSEDASFITTETTKDTTKDEANTINIYNQNNLTTEENPIEPVSSIKKREITIKSKQRLNKKLKNSKIN